MDTKFITVCPLNTQVESFSKSLMDHAMAKHLPIMWASHPWQAQSAYRQAALSIMGHSLHQHLYSE